MKAAVILAGLGLANAQAGPFLRPVAVSGYSSSISMGEDGRVHEEVHEMEMQAFRSRGAAMKTLKLTDCFDGHCTESSILRARPFASFHSHLTKLLFGAPAPPAGDIDLRLIAPEPRANVAFLAPRPAMVVTDEEPPLQSMPMPKQQIHGATPAVYVALVWAIVSLVGMITALVHMKCRESQARELEALEQPLAVGSQAVTAALPPARKSQALPTISEEVPEPASGVEHYLAKVYSREAAKEEAGAVKTYLQRTYEKACA